MVRRCLAVALALLPCAAYAAADGGRAPAARVLVDLEPAPGVPTWFGRAFARSIAQELAGFERIALVPRPDTPQALACGDDLACRLPAYRAAGIDVVLAGQVFGDEIRYELFQTWTPARIGSGTIEVGRGQSMVGLQHATRDALHPVLKHGGLLDQRAPPGVAPIAPPSLRSTHASAGWWALGGALFLALPFIALGVRLRDRAVFASRSAWLSGVAGAALVAVALAPAELAATVTAWPRPAAGLGGLAWGVFLVSCLRTIFPPVDGLARVAYRDLARILAAWTLAAIERLAFLAVLYAPFGLLTWQLAESLALPIGWTIMLLAPAVALLAHLWYDAWVEGLAIVLDRRLVAGAASADNPWSREIGNYLGGYVRRTGWDLDPELLARARFLPGRELYGRGVVSYGPGRRARIVVDEALLIEVMGPLLDVRPDEQPALWPDWIVATAVARTGGGRGKRRAATRAGDFRGHKQRSAAPGAQRKPIGVPATLLGHVSPAPGQVVPLISDSPQDLAVVRELLSEHYPWTAPDPDDEYDATDPTDKDLLFGALVRELGAVRRRETALATVVLALGRRVAGLAARHRTRLADAYPLLAFARDHLVQFLYRQWAAAPDPALLTARARPDRLAERSQKIFAAVAAGRKDEPRAARAIRARLVWLSRFFPEPIALRRRRWVRWAIGAAAVAALALVGHAAVRQAIDYHPIYEERIAAQERELAAARARAQDEEPEKGPADGRTDQGP